MRTLQRLCLALVIFNLWVIPLNVSAQETSRGVWRVQWSPDGNKLAVADLNGNIYVIDVSTNVTEILSGHSLHVYALAWSPDGEFLASGGALDRFIYLWNIANATLQQHIYPFAYDTGVLDPGIGHIAWSLSGEYMIATSFDTFQFWEATSWTALEPSRRGSLIDAEWSPDGTLLAVTDIYSLSFFNGQTLTTDNLETDVMMISGENPGQLSWNPTGELIVTADRRDPFISIWDVPTRTQIATLSTSGPLFKDVVFISDDRIVAVTEAGTLYLLDTAASVLATVETGVSEVRSLAWNPQRQLFAIGGEQTVIDEDGVTGLPFVELSAVLPVTPTPTPTPAFTPTPSVTCSATIMASDSLALVNAISAANANGASHDAICLAPDSTYTFASASNSTALPAITTPIIIVGNGSACWVMSDRRLLVCQTCGHEQIVLAFRTFRPQPLMCLWMPQAIPYCTSTCALYS